MREAGNGDRPNLGIRHMPGIVRDLRMLKRRKHEDDHGSTL